MSAHPEIGIDLEQEAAIKASGQAFFERAPTMYDANQDLIERSNRGEVFPESFVFGEYFKRMEELDPQYLEQIRTITAQRAERFPEAVDAIATRRLQIVVPAYREAENLAGFLESMKAQIDDSPEGNWGVTLAMDYPIPGKFPDEPGALAEMITIFDQFIANNPDYAKYFDFVTYARRLNSDILSVGLPRTVGEDVLMYEKLAAAQQGKAGEQPFYIGLMDTDTAGLSAGLFDEMERALPEDQRQRPRVVRVRGGFLRDEVIEDPVLHPYEIMWEGSTSAVGKQTTHNPFNIGRLSAVPARELAMTGGGFAKQLNFPDEDIRKGIQMSWQLNNIETVELKGRYQTSGRRELKMMQGLMQMVEDRHGVFDTETLRVAGLIEMYGKWTSETFRRSLGNVGNGVILEHFDPIRNPDHFNHAVPPELIEAMTNSFYRFTTFVMFAIDKLATTEFEEFDGLRRQFLAGEIPYFEVELTLLDRIRNIYKRDPARFEQMSGLLEEADTAARQAIAAILIENDIAFQYEPPNGPILGILEDSENDPEDDGGQHIVFRNGIQLQAPFRILENQKTYQRKLQRLLQVA